MASFVDLDIIEGPDLGMRYTVEEGTFRVIGRKAGFISATVRMNAEGDRELDPAQNAVADEFFSQKARSHFRKRGADILLDDDSISRTHALVFLSSEGPSVVDLMSTNGTKCEGVKISDQALLIGQKIKVGNTTLLVREG